MLAVLDETSATMGLIVHNFGFLIVGRLSLGKDRCLIVTLKHILTIILTLRIELIVVLILTI